MIRFLRPSFFIVCATAASFLPSAAPASPQVTYQDIAAKDGAGITYRRARSPSEAIFDAIKAQPSVTLEDELRMPIHGRGAPGVAILDYDRDGDLDIYVTNGPGAANALYSSQLIEKKELSFVDAATEAGIDATAQDSTGVCYGDIDNDGDDDLLVLGNREPNRLFENRGDGTFADITERSGIGTTRYTSLSCSMGDINGDGLLDVAIANTFDMSHQIPIFREPFALNDPNELYLNGGDNRFIDVSEASGFRSLHTVPPLPPGGATISWTVALVDIDLDGDVDILQADDQGAIFPLLAGGVDRGFIQYFENDGTGKLTNRTAGWGVPPGPWMGLSFGDFDHDGRMDLFSTNFGNQAAAYAAGDPSVLRFLEYSSRYFLQKREGTLVDGADLQPDLHVPFGWGTTAQDYDNDGDTDIIAHGGLDAGRFITLSPAMVLENDGRGFFERDALAFGQSSDHLRRVVLGVASGDLNDDGFVDFVSVSSFDLPNAPLTRGFELGSPFDPESYVVDNFLPVDESRTLFRWTGLQLPDDGTLSVEISSADNGNRSIRVEALGTVGITSRGAVNRSGIGAVLKLTPRGGKPVLKPILGGASHASQDSLRSVLGLGRKTSGTLEVLWPGGVKNRLYGVRAGSRVLFPEIPCSFDDTSAGFDGYLSCVKTALGELTKANVITRREARRFLSSAMVAYLDANPS